jgi:hypothetical protein
MYLLAWNSLMKTCQMLWWKTTAIYIVRVLNSLCFRLRILFIFISFLVGLQRTCTWSPFYLSCLIIISQFFILSITGIWIDISSLDIKCIYSHAMILCVISILIILIKKLIYILMRYSTLIKCMASIKINVYLCGLIVISIFLWICIVVTLNLTVHLLINFKKWPIILYLYYIP